MFDQATVEMLMEGVVDTLYMTIVSTFFSYVFGIVMAVVLVICRKDGIRPNPVVYSVLDVVVNLTRSFPFLILMIAVIPFTRYIVGTTIGNNATVVPLVIAAAPFVARLIESSLLEVDNGVVEAAQSMGASTWQIITKVLLPEAMPSLINGSAVAAITILESMMEFNRLPDPEVLVRLHHDVAGALMNGGRIQDAEKHLLKAMQIGVRGAGDYIDVHGPRNI